MSGIREFRQARFLWLLLGILLVGACGVGENDAFIHVKAWQLPAQAIPSAQPDLVVDPDGTLLLSWVETGEGKRRRLQLARFDPGPGSAGNGQWTSPMTIATGTDWFLNWADTPHVYALEDGSLWAHWLRSTGPGRMDYGIDLVRSADGGKSWSSPKLVNLPDSPGDHGFVSFWPQSRNQLGMAWLDSRQKAEMAATMRRSDGDGHGAGAHDHHGGGAMMLRRAVYDATLQMQGEWPLDTSTCDCCTTSAAMTRRGAVVVYRGRTQDEVRDTRIVRFDGHGWTAPRDVHSDGWHTAGCPVNGPVVAADGDTVWVAWYTEADGLPEVRMARSDDAGNSFAAPVTVAKGPQVLGRISMALSDEGVLLAWLEQTVEETQRLLLGHFDRSLRARGQRDVARIVARGRASGMPRLRVANGAAWLVWTDVEDGKPLIRGAMVH